MTSILQFKRKENIIRHIVKVVSHGYGGCSCYSYSDIRSHIRKKRKEWIKKMMKSNGYEDYFY